MITSNKVIVMAILITQAIGAPQTNSKTDIPPTFKNPANLSYEELNFIVKTRFGENTSKLKPKTMTPCARAILGCCRDGLINENCSESLKCGAFFFDANPCDEKFLVDALNAAQAFYEQFNNVN